MQTKSSHSWIFKISLLSISLMLMIAPNIAAAIPLMAKTFTGQSASAVETLSTVPNLGIIFGIFFGELLTLRIGDKRTVLCGLAIAFIAGIIPIFSNVYNLVLVARFSLGLGIGLLNSLAISMISKYFSGDELSSMMGYQNAVQSLGSSVMSFAVGYLIIFGWHATFLIYAIALPIFLLFMFVIPRDSGVSKNNTGKKEKPSKHQSVNFAVIMISVMTFFLYVFFMIITVQLSTLVTSRNLGSASQASSVLGVMTLVSMLASLVYGRVYKYLKSWVLPLGFIVMSVGFGFVGMMNALSGVTAGVVIIGIGFAMVIPYIYTMLMLRHPKGRKIWHHLSC